MKKLIITAFAILFLTLHVSAQNPTPASPKSFDTLYPRNGDSSLETAQKTLALQSEQTFAAGNDTTSTSATGSNWVALTAHPCRHVTVFNGTGTAISVRYGTGAGISLPTATSFTFVGLTDASGLQVQRTDVSGTQVSVNFNYVNW